MTTPTPPVVDPRARCGCGHVRASHNEDGCTVDRGSLDGGICSCLMWWSPDPDPTDTLISDPRDAELATLRAQLAEVTAERNEANKAYNDAGRCLYDAKVRENELRAQVATLTAEVERMRARYHPMQHVEMVGEVARFRANAIVRWLVDDRDAHGHETLNDIAYRVDFRREDHEQLAQLIGYSVSGAGDLDYVDDETLAIADAAVEALTNRGEEG